MSLPISVTKLHLILFVAVAMSIAAIAMASISELGAQARGLDPVLNPDNGHYYQAVAVPGGVFWEDARRAAESQVFADLPGHLATITSQAENDFITIQLPGAVDNHYWLGGFQPSGSPEPDGNWQWITGEPFVFANWAPGEPNDAGGEDAIHFWPALDQWNDEPRQSPMAGYVVEFGPQRPQVDAATLDEKVMFGYQGWFGCPGDGSPPDRWFHWFDSDVPTAEHATVDYWPAVSELSSTERCVTNMTLPDGSPATVYSSFNQATVLRHFQWMEDYGIDGIFLQRFLSELGDPAFFQFRNQVAQNARLGAEIRGRVFAMMYDIAGANGETLVDDIKSDWEYLVDTLLITESPRYLTHRGKPVVAIWGIGFTHTESTPEQAMELIDYFQSTSEPRYQATLMGGLPTHWRTLTGDSKTDPAWAEVYRALDVISPWTVGRYEDEAGADAFKDDLIIPDMAEAASVGAEYLPVVWPGFSWHNLFNESPSNQISRNGGRFYWRQVYNALSAGANMLYVAMFDEVDEGTAMFKLAPTPNELPAQGIFVPLDIDGYSLPSDWYLRLGDETGKAIRGEIPLTEELPLPLPVGCALDLEIAYTGDVLSIAFVVGTPTAATWNVWVVIGSNTIRLFSRSVPIIKPPVTRTVSIPGPINLGNLGFLAVLTTPDTGITCSDWETVETSPIIPDGAAARALRRGFSSLR